MANLWRRLIIPIRVYPWKLGDAFNPNVPEHRRLEVARTFMECPPCCLDPLFGKKFRALCREPSDVLNPDKISFVVACFENALVSTSWVENQFALIRQWLLRTQKPLSMATLGAKFCTHHWRKLHSRDCDDQTSSSSDDYCTTFSALGCPHHGLVGPPAKSPGKKRKRPCRPLWAKRAGPVNGENVFVGEFLRGQRGEGLARAKIAFNNLELEEKARYSLKAKRLNAERRIVQDAAVASALADQQVLSPSVTFQPPSLLLPEDTFTFMGALHFLGVAHNGNKSPITSKILPLRGRRSLRVPTLMCCKQPHTSKMNHRTLTTLQCEGFTTCSAMSSIAIIH